MQAASDIMLGWIRVDGLDGVERDFYIRQLWDQKGSARDRGDGAGGLTPYAQLCGMDARAGSRTVGRRRRDLRATSGRATRSTGRMAAFAEAYADQNERDYAALQNAVAEGRVAANTGL